MPGKDPRPTNKRATGRGTNQSKFDASPETDDGPSPMAGQPGSPRSIHDTQAWQDGSKGVSKAWRQYKEILKQSFGRLSRMQQEIFVLRMCQAVTIGSAILALSIFYPFIPTQVRVLLLPLVVVGSWYCGTKVVAPQMMGRFLK